MSRPLVSVFMMTYNHEKYIAQALDSVLMQKCNFHYEIVIGEDCSTDNTRSILLSYKEKNPEKIKLLLHEKNIGAANNQNEVFKNCTGKYVAMLEGDDYWTDPCKLQKQVDFLETNPEYVLTTHTVQVVNEKGQDLGRDRDLGYKTGGNRTFHLSEMLGGAGFHPNSWVFRSSAIKKLPWYVNYCVSGDDVLMVTILRNGKGYYFNDTMSHYRIHGGGIWSTQSLIERAVNYIHFFSFTRKEYPEYRKPYNRYIWFRIKEAGYQLSLKNMRTFLRYWFNLPKFPFRFSIPVLLLIFLAYGAKIIYVRLPEGFIGRIRNRKNQGF